MKTKAATFGALALALTFSLAPMASAQDSGSGAAQPPQGQAQPQDQAQPQGQVPQPQSGGVDWKGVGVGAGTLGANVLYIPAKLVYGILGGIGGGAGYLLTGGNTQVSDTIWRSSLGGDYVVTPDMIKGDQPVHFSGPTETAPSPVNPALPPVSSASPDNGGSAVNGANNSLAPVQPMNSANNSLAPARPMTTSSVPPSGGMPDNGSVHPMDNGTGPVGSGSSQGGSSHHPAAPLPDTNIE
jgi:hypothetical protein